MTVAQRLYLLIFSAVVRLASLAGLGIVQMDQIYTAANYANVDTVPSLLTLDETFNLSPGLQDFFAKQIAGATNDPGKKLDTASLLASADVLILNAES